MCRVGEVDGIIADLDAVDAEPRREVVGGEEGFGENDAASTCDGVDGPDNAFDRVGGKDGVAIEGGQAVESSCVRKGSNLRDGCGVVIGGEEDTEDKIRSGRTCEVSEGEIGDGHVVGVWCCFCDSGEGKGGGELVDER